MAYDDETEASAGGRSISDRLIALEIQFRYMQRDIIELKSSLGTQSQVFTDDQVRKVLRIVEVFEEDSSDKKEFDRSVRISVITMVISVLIFSILVPVIQHYLLH